MSWRKHSSNSGGSREHFGKDPSNKVWFSGFLISKRNPLCEVVSEKATDLEVQVLIHPSAVFPREATSKLSHIACHLSGLVSDHHVPPRLYFNQIYVQIHVNKH